MTDDTQWLTAREQLAWRAYLRGNRLLESGLDRDLQDYGIALTEYEILSMLSEQPGRSLRMSELADLVVQSRSRLTHTANRLAKRGWVERRSVAGDGRGVELWLTDSGFDELQRVAAVHVDSVRKRWFDRLSPELVEAIGIAMSQVRTDLGGHGPATDRELGRLSAAVAVESAAQAAPAS